MLLETDFPPDVRVEKEAISLISKGHQVTVASYTFDRNKPIAETVNGINIVNASPDKLNETDKLLKDNNISVSAIGSPIGKVRIDRDFDEHFELFKHTVDVAMQLNSKLIRIFSYYPPLNKDINDYQDEIIDRMREKLDFIKGLPVILTHENEARIYGQTSQNCRYLAEKLNSQQFRLTYDPANFVWSMGIKNNVQSCLPEMMPYINHVHIKDWIVGSQIGSIPGKGDGQIPQLLEELKKKNYSGFLTLEPHLEKGEQFGGSTSSQLFALAVDSLRQLCE